MKDEIGWMNEEERMIKRGRRIKKAKDKNDTIRR